jgi:hypothetical protein
MKDIMEETNDVVAQVEQPVEKIKVAEFLKMYNEDGIGNVLKNVEYWIRNTFTTLSSFK